MPAQDLAPRQAARAEAEIKWSSDWPALNSSINTPEQKLSSEEEVEIHWYIINCSCTFFKLREYCTSGLGGGVCYNNSIAVNITAMKKKALNVL